MLPDKDDKMIHINYYIPVPVLALVASINLSCLGKLGKSLINNLS